MGLCTIAPLAKDEREAEALEPDSDIDEEENIIIPFQNEFLYVAYENPNNDPSKRKPLCCVPDLISILGQDGEAIGSQELRYGLRVSLIAMAAHPLWTDDERGLRVGGPQGFGLDIEWNRNSLGAYQKPKSVIEEFGH